MEVGGLREEACYYVQCEIFSGLLELLAEKVRNFNISLHQAQRTSWRVGVMVEISIAQLCR